VEAGGLQEKQEAFVAETGLPFSFIFVLSEGASGNPAVSEDAIAYADRIGSPNFPILAGGDGSIVDATPMTQEAHPEICAFTPDLEIIECFVGHGGSDDALDVIRSHAGIE
jgi:hypothetical protein